MRIIKGEIPEEFYKKIESENPDGIENLILDVKNNGDDALIKYSRMFGDGDFASPSDFVVSEDEIQESFKKVDTKLVESINTAISNVREFANGQINCIQNLKMSVQKYKNSFLGHRIIPVENVLCYVPGGNYPLVSSVIMSVIPARVAGVKNIYVTSPKISPEVLAASKLAGAKKVFKLGGAQAISAFAYGTNTVPKVDKIVGPGNKYVNFAKKYVYGECGIDFIAGPSEVMIIADDSSNPELISADMLAQCEHDRDARAYLICDSEEFAAKVQDSAVKQLESLQTKEIASYSFEKSFCIIEPDLNKKIEIANRRAPEHLELVYKNPENSSKHYRNYGSLFIGQNCAEVFGDYCSGTNHILPTNQVARYHGGLSVFDFVKIQTYQKIDPKYAKLLSEVSSKLAEAEGLFAHKLASDLRGEKN